MFTPEQRKELEAPLARSNVKTREQSGMKLSYLEGWHVLAEANRIFGFDGWSSETIETKCVAEGPRKVGNGEGFGVTYIARVRISVGQTLFRDGTGTGHGVSRSLGDAHESAIKEAETDARKRALMTFGNQFGLALYDKSQENVEDDTRSVPKPSVGATQSITSADLRNYAAQPASKPKMTAADWALQELAIIRACPTPKALKEWESANGIALHRLKLVDPALHQDMLDNLDARAKALLAA